MYDYINAFLPLNNFERYEISNFAKKGFVLIGIFDKNEAASGQLINGIPIRHISGLEDFCLENKPVVAVLCVPKEKARELTKSLIQLGIKGFWN